MKKILVVDDSGVQRKMIIQIIKKAGFENEILEAGDGSQAIEVMATNVDEIALVLCDWNMPNMTGLEFIEGIEVSARHDEYDLHILGYSKSFNRDVLHKGLKSTRDGYLERMDQMVWQCQQAGYDKITMDEVRRRRSDMQSPVFVSYDLAGLLEEKYRMSIKEARSLTTTGGVCHVPYGDWAMSPAEAILLIHESGGLAVWAHAGVMIRDRDVKTLKLFMENIAAAGVDGLELFHPVHGQDEMLLLREFVVDYELLVTGGSDWHGPGRYEDSDLLFGDIGSSEDDWKALLNRMI